MTSDTGRMMLVNIPRPLRVDFAHNARKLGITNGEFLRQLMVMFHDQEATP